MRIRLDVGVLIIALALPVSTLVTKGSGAWRLAGVEGTFDIRPKAFGTQILEYHYRVRPVEVEPTTSAIKRHKGACCKR